MREKKVRKCFLESDGYLVSDGLALCRQAKPIAMH